MPRVVAYVAGSGRSGSTLLDRTLGSLQGCVSIGEVRLLWQEGLIENRSCGCGSPFAECRFWTEVGQRAFGGWDKIDAAAVVVLGQAVARNRFFLWLLFPRVAPTAYKQKLAQYQELLHDLYSGVAQVSGADVIVDSSKDPAYALVLARSREVTVKVLQLVRDVRGVAFSWNKRLPTDPVTGQPPLPVYHPVATGFRWILFNVLVELATKRVDGLLRITYEDLLESFGAVVKRAASFLGRPVHSGDLAFFDGETIELQVHHTVSGHPTRSRKGRVKLRLDDAWISSMRRSHRYAVTFIAAPLLLRYGYPLRARGRRVNKLGLAGDRRLG